MGKGYNNYMTKKFFHPGSKDNIKRVWMAQQKAEYEKTKEEEMDAQYQREQEMYENRALLGDQKAKLGLSFMYDAPPGAKKVHEKEDDEPEYKFEWQRRFNAPREQYAKGDETIRDQPFGIEVRNVRCIKCHKWGHVNTDKICPLFGKNLTAEPPPPGPTPSTLLQGMKEEGLAFKKCVSERKVNPDDPNEQLVAASDDEEDPEVRFLKSLTPKQKKKLLKKLDDLAKQQKDGTKHKKKKKGKRKRKDSTTTDDDESAAEKSKKDGRKRKHDKHRSPPTSKEEARPSKHRRDSKGDSDGGPTESKRDQLEMLGRGDRIKRGDRRDGSHECDREDRHSSSRRKSPDSRDTSAQRFRDRRKMEHDKERRQDRRDSDNRKESERQGIGKFRERETLRSDSGRVEHSGSRQWREDRGGRDRREDARGDGKYSRDGDAHRPRERGRTGSRDRHQRSISPEKKRGKAPYKHVPRSPSSSPSSSGSDHCPPSRRPKHSRHDSSSS